MLLKKRKVIGTSKSIAKRGGGGGEVACQEENEDKNWNGSYTYQLHLGQTALDMSGSGADS